MTKELKVITKDWFKNNIISFDKNFLSKKYTNIKENKKIKDQLVKIFGSDFMNQIDEAGTENNLFNKKVRRETAIIKMVEVEELPSSNDADENVMYAIKDNKAIDEDCKYHLYVAVDDDEEESKVWAEISSPSYIFEDDNIDFEAEFRNYDILFKKKHSYYNWESLQTKLLTFEESYNYSLNKKVRGGEFVYNSKMRSFPTVNLWYDGENLYVDNEEYKGDKDAFAQTILDESNDSEEEEIKYFYIATRELGSNTYTIYGSYNEEKMRNGVFDEDVETIKKMPHASGSMLANLTAEKYDGKENEDGAIYKYIGPKYTYIYNQYGSSGLCQTFKYDGTRETSLGTTYTEADLRELMNNLGLTDENNLGLTDENGRTYKKYDAYNWSDDIRAINELMGE